MRDFRHGISWKQIDLWSRRLGVARRRGSGSVVGGGLEIHELHLSNPSLIHGVGSCYATIYPPAESRSMGSRLRSGPALQYHKVHMYGVRVDGNVFLGGITAICGVGIGNLKACESGATSGQSQANLGESCASRIVVTCSCGNEGG